MTGNLLARIASTKLHNQDDMQQSPVIVV